MKTYMLIVAMLIALFAIAAMAHTTLAAGSCQKCACMTGLAQIGKEIGVTDSQKAQIKTIVSGAMAEVKAVKSNTTLSCAAQTEQVRNIRRDAHQAVFAVLTPDQKAQVRALMGARFAKNLGLTPDQQGKLKALRADETTKIAAMRADTTLTLDQRHAAMKKLHDDYTAQIALILTPDQQTKLAEMRAQRQSWCAGVTPDT